MTEPPPPVRHSKYVPALDGIRGINWPLTVLTHYTLFFTYLGTCPGWLRHTGPLTLNIEIFFVLSGALITSLLVSEHDKTRRISLRMFYVRRFRRLGPAMLVVLPLLIVLEVAVRHGRPLVGVQPLGPSAWVTIVGVVVFLGNWRLFSQAAGLGWLGPTWTLAIEEQFYATWPTALGVMLRRRLSRPVVLLALAILTVLCTGISSISQAHLPNVHVTYMTTTQLPLIFVGCALGYEVSVNPSGGVSRLLRSPLAGLAGVAALTVMALTMHNRAWALQRGGYVLYGLAAALLVGHCLMADRRSPVGRFFGWKPFVVAGQVSYEAYLVHCIVILAVIAVAPSMPVNTMLILDSAIIVAFSALFYYFVAGPVRRRGWRAAFSRPEIQPDGVVRTSGEPSGAAATP